MTFIVAIGVYVRGHDLAKPVLLNDEGESSLNALSILEHGVPWWEYQGLPLFENTLTLPWLEHREYEFRDISYSDRGVAVYHGWLPLYAMAASFALCGVAPDAASDPPRVLHDRTAAERREWAARAPAVAFAVLFMLAIYGFARELYGPDAGLLALGIAALADNAIWMGQQARYFSAATALSTLALWGLWRFYQTRRWRDAVWSGVALALLFHTHAVSFVVAATAGVLLALVQRERPWPKYCAIVAIAAAALGPWAFATGMISMPGSNPAARGLLLFPDDYWVYFRLKPRWSLMLAATAAGMLLFEWMRSRLPLRVAQPLAAARGPVWFLFATVLLAYAAFLGLMPAASFFLPRLSLSYLAPMTVLAAILAAALLRIVAPRRAFLFAAALVLAAGLSSERFWTSVPPALQDAALHELAEHFSQSPLRPGAKLYADPMQQFAISFLTGLPVQSIAPIRRSFLDEYAGDVVYIETTPRAAGGFYDCLRDNPAIFRGHEVDQLADFWPVFFYRFVEPERRRGANANFAARLQGAKQHTLPSGWKIYESPEANSNREI